MPGPDRQPHLDGLRGLAILSVVIWHYVGSFLGYEQLTPEGDFPTGPLALAWAGVDVFFVLSGYLITEILRKAALATNYFSVFWIRRACRLVPLYTLAIGSYFFGRWYFQASDSMSVHFQKSGIPDWAWFLGVQNVLMAWKHSFGPAWLAVTWSLAVEVQFYLVWAMALRWLPLRGIWTLALLGIVAAPLIRWQFEPLAGYVSLISRCDSFFGGAIVALFTEKSRESLYQQWRAVTWSSLALCLLLLGVMICQPGYFGAVTPWYSVGSPSLIMATTSLLLCITNHEPENWLTRGLSAPWLVRTGIIAYGIYLVHQPTRILIQHNYGLSQHHDAMLSAWSVTIILSLASTYTLALILHYSLERPFIALGRHLSYHNR